MNRLFILLAVCIGLCGCATTIREPEVCFVPGQDCANAVVHEINQARHTIRMQAYGFTHPGIAQALIAAQRRGVDVELILDKSNLHQHSSEAEPVSAAGVKTFIDSRHAIAHNKVIVIDGREVITGSFNFTTAADTRNAENLIILKDSALATRYLVNWQQHKGHSESYNDEK